MINTHTVFCTCKNRKPRATHGVKLITLFNYVFFMAVAKTIVAAIINVHL